MCRSAARERRTDSTPTPSPVGGVVFRDLGCEKAPLGVPGREPKDRGGLSGEEPLAWIGIQEVGGAARAER